MSGRSQMAAMNGKRPFSVPSRYQSETLVAQHFDLIKYVNDSWNSVSRELDMCHNQSHNSSNHRNTVSVTYYQEHEPNPQLKNFEPFNLEAWWGQRVVQSITKNANS